MRGRTFVAVSLAMMLLGGIIAARADAKDLDGVTQNWDKTLPANDPGGPCPASSSRFSCVMNNAAVRDNETGLVWEQSPSTATFFWEAARDHCAHNTVGNRHGWRLPSVVELTSLLAVPTSPNPTPPILPSEHPFSNISLFYWSATFFATDNPALEGGAWTADFNTADIGVGSRLSKQAKAWCVRGGMNTHQY